MIHYTPSLVGAPGSVAEEVATDVPICSVKI